MLPTESPDDWLKKKGYDPSSVDIKLTQLTRAEYEYEAPAVLKARLEQEALDKEHNRRKERLKSYTDIYAYIYVYALAGILILVITLYSLIKLQNPASTKEDKDFAKSAITIVSSAVGGYLFGNKNSSSKS